MIRSIFAGVLLTAVLTPPSWATELEVDATVRVVINEIDLATLPARRVTVTTLPGMNSPAGDPILQLQVPAMAVGTTALSIGLTGAAPLSGAILDFDNSLGSFTRPDLPPVQNQILDGLMPLNGVVKVCLFTACSSPVVPANLSIPLNVIGGSGQQTTSGTTNAAFTVQGAPWIAGTTTAMFETASGTITGSSAIGQDAGLFGPMGNTQTASFTGGVVQLVSPIFISTNIAPLATIEGFVELELLFVPEPALIAAQGSAISVLLLLGWRRIRRR